jgi:hypothetical protein
MDPIRAYIIQEGREPDDIEDIYDDEDEELDDEWSEDGALYDREIVGDYITQYLDAMYKVDLSILLWLKQNPKAPTSTLKKIYTTIDNNMYAYASYASITKVVSELKRLNIEFEGAFESIQIEEAAPASFLKKLGRKFTANKMLRFAEVFKELAGVISVISGLSYVIISMRKKEKIINKNKATKVKLGSIFEGVILPNLRTILKNVLSRKIRDKKSLKREFFRIQDTIIKNSPAMRQYIQFLGE